MRQPEGRATTALTAVSTVYARECRASRRDEPVSHFHVAHPDSAYGLTNQGAWNNIVITVRAVHISIRQIGNSQGIVIPKPVLAQLGLDGKAGVEMTIEDGALVLRRPASPARTGWAEAARSIAEAGDDELVMGEFGNAGDSELVW
jgi:antitoxin MazE